MPARSKIEDYGLSEDALELKAEGKTNAQIARALSEQGRPITQMGVHRFFEKYREKTSAAMNIALARNHKLAEKKTEQHLDAVAQLLHVNEQTLEILRFAKAAADYSTALQAIKRVEAQLLLQSQLLGQLQQPQTVIFNITRAVNNGRCVEAQEW